MATDQLMTRESHQVDGLVMTDVKQYYSEWTRRKPEFMDRSDLGVWTSDCTCSACKQGRGTIARPSNGWSTFTKLSDKSELDPADYLLCPSEIPAFVFRSRHWGESSDFSLLTSS